MSKEWTHPQCERCWIAWNSGEDEQGRPTVRRPVQLKERELEWCCWCDSSTIAGIYVRSDPNLLGCRHTVEVGS